MKLVKLFVACLLGLLPVSAAADSHPSIHIAFEDDASSLVIAAEWAEAGQPKRETFSLGKNMHVNFNLVDKTWTKAQGGFKSKNWEAYLMPDGSGFLLMEREFNGLSFENLGLTLYQYYPKRAEIRLRAANGSPYWKADSSRIAIVNMPEGDKLGSIAVYDTAQGQLISSELLHDSEEFKKATANLLRARVCDDSVPCENSHDKKDKDK